MPNGETFQNPTVQQVFFEIRFPNLFFMESKIGEIQLKIMEKFPISQLIHAQNMVFANIQPFGLPPGIVLPEQPIQAQGEKIWRFQTQDSSTTLNILTSSLNIVSNKYKSYNNDDAIEKFRDILNYTIEPFLKITALPKISRIGLRYIDNCPWPGFVTEKFNDYYNSAYPVDRFAIEDTTAYDFATIVNRGPYKLRYAESLSVVEGNPKFVMDFDGSAEMVSSSEWLVTTDHLHDLISSEYNSTIKDPVRAIMRNPTGG